MAKYGSSSIAVFLVDGYNVLASALKALRWKVSVGSEDCTGLGDTWMKNSPTGVSKAEFSQSGAYFDDTTNGIHDAFKAAGVTSRIVTWCSQGNTVGKAFIGMQGAFSLGYEVLGRIAGLTNAEASYVVSGQADRGTILLPSAALTATWTGTTVDYTLDPSQRVIPITSNSIANPTVVTTPVPHGLTTGQVILIAGVSTSSPTINGQQTVTVTSSTTFTVAVNVTIAGTGGTFVRASTVNGGAGYQSVSDYSGFTGVVGKIRHSADDSTYADLITFTNVTSGPTAERATVAGTVNRYLKSTGTVTGSGSITPFVGFSRG